MNNWIALLGDICVILFDLLIYNRMIVPRNDSVKSKGILYTGCGLIVVYYIIAVYVWGWPVSAAAFFCMTIPSLLLFWFFSKYRDSRFFLTFCFVDTVSLIIGYVARYIGILFGNMGSILSIIITLFLFSILYRMGKPYFKEYQNLLETISKGWRVLMISSFLIYCTLIFTAIYPNPLIERMEYGPPYLMLCAMIISFYMVFLTEILQTKKVYDQSQQLKEQQKWFHLAYVDALTEVPNRMAYMEKLHELERARDLLVSTVVVVFDLNNFKAINDTWGHSCGDEVLKKAASLLVRTFDGEKDFVYRIGGDEFAAISVGTNTQQITEKLEKLKGIQNGEIPYSISSGYSFVNTAEDNSMEQAFSRADEMMYTAKRRLSHEL